MTYRRLDGLPSEVPEPHYSEAILLGPCRCRGCGQDVAWLHDGTRHLGWLHPSGMFSCPKRKARAV